MARPRKIKTESQPPAVTGTPSTEVAPAAQTAAPAPARRPAAPPPGTTSEASAPMADLRAEVLKAMREEPGSILELHGQPAQTTAHEDAAAPLDEEDETPAPDQGEATHEEPAPADTAEGSPEQIEAEAEDTGPDDDDLDGLAALDEEALTMLGKRRQWPESFTRRIGKLTKKMRALEAQLDGAQQLREERDALREQQAESGQQAAPTIPQAASAHEQQLMQRIGAHEHWLDQLEANPDGIAIEGKEYSAEDIRRAKRKMQTDLATAQFELNQWRAGAAEATRKHEADAVTLHPWLKDKRNDNTVAIENSFRAYPVLKSIPDARSILADALAYRKLLQSSPEAKKLLTDAAAFKAATEKKPAASTTQRPVTRQPGRPAAAPPAARSDQVNLQSVAQAALGTGGTRQKMAALLPSLIE